MKRQTMEWKKTFAINILAKIFAINIHSKRAVFVIHKEFKQICNKQDKKKPTQIKMDKRLK